MAMIFVYVTIFLAQLCKVSSWIVYPLFTEVFEAYDNLNNSIQNLSITTGGQVLR